MINSCVQDNFARARTRPKRARPSARATIGYLICKINRPNEKLDPGSWLFTID